MKKEEQGNTPERGTKFRIVKTATTNTVNSSMIRGYMFAWAVGRIAAEMRIEPRLLLEKVDGQEEFTVGEIWQFGQLLHLSGKEMQSCFFSD